MTTFPPIGNIFNVMRKEFEMTEAQLKSILDASKPTPVMYLSGGQPMFDSPQENANRAWKSLASELGFVWDSCEPVSGKPQRFFTAEVIESNNNPESKIV